MDLVKWWSDHRTMTGPARWPVWAVVLAGAVYATLETISIRLFNVPSQGISALWVPAGFLVATLILTVRAQWALVGFTFATFDLARSLLSGDSVAQSAAYAFASILCGWLVSVVLLRWSGPTPTFGRVRDVICLVLAASMVGAVVSGLLAALTATQLGTGEFSRVWPIWVSSATIGTLLVAPALVALLREPAWKYRTREPRRVEGAIFLLITIVGTVVLFRRSSGIASLPFLILPYPVLIWVALRLRPATAQGISLVLAGIVTWYTLRGTGPLMLLSNDPIVRVVWVQAYLLLCVLSTQLVAAAAQDRLVAYDDIAARQQRSAFVSKYARDVIVILEPDGVFSFVTDASAAVFGRSPESLLGHQLFEFVHPDDAARIRDGVANLRARVIPEPLVLRYRVKHADGHWIWIEVTTGLADEPGLAPGRFVNVCRDVTERRKIERRMAQASRMEGLGQLAGGLAHDFNNVLQVVLAGTEELLDDPVGAGSRETLTHIREAGQRGVDITRQLLALGREKQATPKPIAVDATIARFLPSAGSAAGRSTRISLALSATDSHVLLVTNELEQVVLNLVLNARDAMDGVGDILITSSMVDRVAFAASLPAMIGEGPWIEISVADNGPGVTPDLRERIFEPFFSTKSTETGSGLGLASVYAIVDRANGVIWCDETPGGGATFRIVLPAFTEQPAQIAAV